SITWRQACKSYLGALSLGLITPGRLGEYARGIFIPQLAGRALTGAGRVFLDNWSDLLGVLVWGLLGWTDLIGLGGMAIGLLLLAIALPIGPWLTLSRWLAEKMPSWKGLREFSL